jgi:O-antigen ligase
MPIAVRIVSLTTPMVAAALGLVAVADPKLALVGSLAIVFGVLMLADVRVGICLFAFTTTLLNGVGGGVVSADKLVSGALALSWIAAVAIRQDVRDEIVDHTPGYAALVLMLGLWYTTSVLWAEDAGEARYHLIRVAPNLLILPIAVSAIGTVRTLRWTIISLLVGSLVSAAVGAITGAGAAGSEGRLFGSGLDSNTLAMWLIMASAMTYGVLAATRDPLARMLIVAGIGGSTLAVFATGSRAGLISAAVTLLVIPLLAARRHRAVAIAFGVVLVLCGTVYFTTFATDAVRERITLVDLGDGGSGRTDLWAVGIRMVEAHPIGGVGGGNFVVSSIHYLLEDPGAIKQSRYIVDHPEVAHNTFLQVSAETGLVGGGLFTLLFVNSFLYALRAIRRFRLAGLREHELLARGIAIAFVGIFTNMFFVAVDTARPLWLLLALGPVLHKLARQDAAGVPVR